MEFIREFQEIMNKAIEQLLNKPARRHSCWKDKPELRTEQGKHRETICQEVEKLPQHNVTRESDDEQNSVVSQEMMDTDQFKDLLGQNWKVLTTLNIRLRILPNTE